MSENDNVHCFFSLYSCFKTNVNVSEFSNKASLISITHDKSFLSEKFVNKIFRWGFEHFTNLGGGC